MLLVYINQGHSIIFAKRLSRIIFYLSLNKRQPHICIIVIDIFATSRDNAERNFVGSVFIFIMFLRILWVFSP